MHYALDIAKGVAFAIGAIFAGTAAAYYFDNAWRLLTPPSKR